MPSRSLANLAGLRWLLGLSLLVLLLAGASRHLELPPVQALERYLFDVRLQLLAPSQPDPRIVILDIDDKALAQHGRWPWRRGLLAELIERSFSDYGALLLGMDLILSEPDDSSGLAALERLQAGPLRAELGFAEQLARLRPELDEDGRLAATMQRHPVVLGFYLSGGEEAVASAALPAPSLAASSPAAQTLPLWEGYGGNLARLQASAGQAGFLNAISDEDGITRRSLLMARLEQGVYASLPLVLAQNLLGDNHLQALQAADGSWRGVQLNSLRGPLQLLTDDDATALVPYRSASADYAHYSAADVLLGRLAPDALRGRVVLLGSSAPGLLDQRATPLAPAYPGVAVHASMLSGILDGNLAHSPRHLPLLEMGLLLLTGLPLLLLLPRLSPLGATALLAGLLLSLLAINVWAWRVLHQAWPLAGPLSLMLGLAGLQLLVANFGARGARRQLTRLFGHYLPPALVAEMSRHPEHYSMASRSAELTVMFADVRGFTGISEHLNPTELAELMNEYFTAMADIIGRHRGTLDKFMGDAVMAFWGAPLADGQHARHAVEAALAMHLAMDALNSRFAVRGWPSLRISIGLNTGSMVVGDLGSRQRRAYTVLGDAVNLAARLQALCAEREAAILLGAATHAALGEWRPANKPLQSLGELHVRGREAPVEVLQC